MRIHIGGDHAAYELQRSLVSHLEESGHEVIDHGPTTYQAEDDYPAYVLRAAQAVADLSLPGLLGGARPGRQHDEREDEREGFHDGCDDSRGQRAYPRAETPIVANRAG